jgi:hypothetical protein
MGGIVIDKKVAQLDVSQQESLLDGQDLKET